MANKRYAENPLLYIDQPSATTPQAPMQHHYYTPKQDHQAHHQEKSKPKKRQTRPLRRTNPFVEEEPLEEKTVAEEVSTEVTTEEPASESKFKDMTLPEKIKYFVERPSHAPIIRCEIRTAERKYQGVIVGEEEDDVFMRVGRRSSSSKIPLAEIIDIRMLGF